MIAFSKKYSLCILCRLAGIVAILTACTDSTIGYPSPGEDAGGDQVTVQLSISTPGNAGTRQTRSTAGVEDVINDVSVLVFEDDIYKYHARGTITGPGSPTVFTAELIVTPLPVRLYIVANAGEFLENLPPAGGIESDIRGALVRQCTAADFDTEIPMFGTVALPSGLQKGTTSIGPVKLLRAVAAMDVTLDDAVANFRLASLEAFRSSDRMQLIPANWNDDATPHVARPYIPRNTTKSLHTAQVAAAEGAGTVTIYLPEATAAAEGENFTKTTCLVAGGYYDGSSAPTYYRIEIPDTQNNGQILRNYRYRFKVTNVTGPGESTPEEAANGTSTKITAVVTNWEENQVDMIFGGEKYFGVSERSIKLPFRTDSDAIDVTTNLDAFTLQWCDEDGVPLPGATEAQAISGPLFDVEILTGAEGTTIQATSTSDNTGDDTQSAYFNIVASPWKIKIRIDQASSAAYKDKYVNILSFGLGIGGFGSTFPGRTNAGDAAAVRNLLGKAENFGPGGTVPVGNILFDYITASTTDEVAMEAYLEKYDIVNISYATSATLSALQCNAIAKWLRASEHRVLIFGRDTDTRISNLWSALFPNAAEVADVWNDTGGLGTAYLSGFFASNSYFTTTGPFGAIQDQTSGNLGIQILDAVWAGMNADKYPGELIPLLKWQGDERLLLCVDKDRRIVYCGDTNMWQPRTNGWNADGIVDNDKQRLLANLFAWMIEEVVMPGKLK